MSTTAERIIAGVEKVFDDFKDFDRRELVTVLIGSAVAIAESSPECRPIAVLQLHSAIRALNRLVNPKDPSINN